MNHSDWQARAGHPPLDLLLLHMEGELESNEAEAVRLHVGQCVPCRAECEQLGRGMARFAAFCDGVALPIPEPRASDLNRRLLASQARSNRGSMIAQMRD